MLTLISTILTAIFFGGLASAIFTQLFLRFREDREYRLHKLEELYVLVDEHCNKFVNYITDYMKKIKSGNWETGTKPTEESHKGYSTIVMIINVYFANLLPALQNIEDAKNLFVTSVGDYVENAIPQTDCIEQMAECVFKINAFGHELKQKIIAHAGNVRKETFFNRVDGDCV